MPLVQENRDLRQMSGSASSFMSQKLRIPPQRGQSSSRRHACEDPDSVHGRLSTEMQLRRLRLECVPDSNVYLVMSRAG